MKEHLASGSATRLSAKSLLLLGVFLFALISTSCAQENISNLSGCFRTASSLQTIFPEDPIREEQLGHTLELTAARNESESAQIVIIPAEQVIKVASVTATDLLGPDNAIISAENITVHLVGYVNIEENCWRGVNRLGLWPDPLLAFRPFECPAGQVRCLWVTLYVPNDSPAGDYVGQVNVTLDNGTVEQVPLRLAQVPQLLSKNAIFASVRAVFCKKSSLHFV